MERSEKCPEPLLAPGIEVEGFRIERVEVLPEIRTVVYLAVHKSTGAKVIHLHCEDRENVFAVAFRTPPKDSSGLPHILEHSVLAGSVNYPVKDAFNELHRSTLQTFINAFTYPDRTIYPVASQVRTDFYHLARVYADLVFRPLLRRETFAQEGYHLEPVSHKDPNTPLTVSGVVFNEMKGAYSSPDNLMFKAIQENLFPDTVYRFDAGGMPEEIVKLTYEDFVSFHRQFYSPANAYFFFYGNILPQEHLAFLSQILSPLMASPVDLSIPKQHRWDKPRVVRVPFPISAGEDPRKKGVVNVAWLLSENNDVTETLILRVLSGILVGTAAGPLRKALIDSRLGEDLSPVTGFEEDMQETFFVAGLRGMDVEMAEKVEEIITESLSSLVKEGIDHKLVEAVLHQVEFAGKEIVRESYPYGLKLMGLVFQTWLYGSDPIAAINFPVLIEAVRRKWKENDRLFEEAISRWLIENPHRLLCIMEPAPSYLAERERKMQELIARLREGLTTEDIERIKRETEQLRVFQLTPDPPEVIKTLPRLKRSDLERKGEIIPTETRKEGSLTFLRHQLFTNGIAYLDLAFDISHLPEDLIPYLPLWGKIMSGMGANGLDYEEMAKRIALKTGGISLRPLCGPSISEGKETWQRLAVRVRALYRNVEEALKIVEDLLVRVDLTDEKRMGDLIVERKNRLLASVVPSGHLMAKMAACASLSLPALREEQWEGWTQLQLLEEVATAFKDDPKAFIEKMVYLKDLVVRRENLIVNLTADGEGLKLLEDNVPGLLSHLRERTDGTQSDTKVPSREKKNLGISVPAEVAYVAGAMKAPLYGEPAVAPTMVASKYLANGFLYRAIRVQGGAYGGSCLYDPAQGIFAFLSYRDPHITRTLKSYRKAAELMVRGKFDAEEIEKAIISAIGAMDRPLDPAGKGWTAFIRYIMGITNEYRQSLRDEILTITPDKLWQGVRDVFASGKGEMVIAVLASEDKLNKANDDLPEKMEIVPLLGVKVQRP